MEGLGGVWGCSDPCWAGWGAWAGQGRLMSDDSAVAAVATAAAAAAVAGGAAITGEVSGGKAGAAAAVAMAAAGAPSDAARSCKTSRATCRQLRTTATARFNWRQVHTHNRTALSPVATGVPSWCLFRQPWFQATQHSSPPMISGDQHQPAHASHRVSSCVAC